MGVALLVLALALGGTASAAAKTQKPNLIVIMADDLGAGELGCYGHPTHRTPHLDELARTGVKFETAFTAPVCHPTRFTIMTGQYGFRTGVLNFPGMRAGPPVRHEGADSIANHLTFAQLLKPAGYATALAGKWQLSGSPPNVVRETGFDEFCIWGYRDHYSPDDRQEAQAAGIDFRSRYWRPSLCRNGQWVPTTDEDYGPDQFVEFLNNFIKRHRDQPFFIYYPMALVHGPLLPTPDTYKPGINRSKSSKAHFAANVEYMDKLIGRLVRTLEETGLRDKTILFFTGDNGTAGGEGKSTATEKGARVPLIVNGPGIVKPRGNTSRLSDLSDIFPTLMDFAGANIPERHVVDGRSLAPFLRGDRDTTRDWIFAYQADYRILRTERWLLEENSPRHFGRLFDCGTNRDGNGYRDITASSDTDAQSARRNFETLLKDLPAPLLEDDGAPNQRLKEKTEKRAKRKGL